jgi:hypothetical protein
MRAAIKSLRLRQSSICFSPETSGLHQHRAAGVDGTPGSVLAEQHLVVGLAGGIIGKQFSGFSTD